MTLKEVDFEKQTVGVALKRQMARLTALFGAVHTVNYSTFKRAILP